MRGEFEQPGYTGTMMRPLHETRNDHSAYRALSDALDTD